MRTVRAVRPILITRSMFLIASSSIILTYSSVDFHSVATACVSRATLDDRGQFSESIFSQNSSARKEKAQLKLAALEKNVSSRK